MSIAKRLGCVGLTIWMGLGAAALGGTYHMYGGVHANWPTEWIPLPALNDPDDGVADNMDVVGDATDPAGYWAKGDDYVYFRMRLDAGTVGSNLLNGSVFVMIDTVGLALTNGPLAFSWDAQSADQTKHGLEMMVSNVLANSWGGTRFNDIDGQAAQKVAPPDFGVSNGDGYIRMTDEVPTTSFGTTTFVDIAAKWSYLRANTMLNTGQTWRIQFGTIANANDHNWIGTDVGANKSPGDTPLSWVDAEETTFVDISDFAVVEVTVQMVRWTTACEQDAVGFYLYRLTDGKWQPVNATLVPAKGGDGMGAEYSIVDPGALSGGTYTYKLVEVETDGTQNEYGPFVGRSGRTEPLALAQPVKSGAEGLVLRWQSRSGERYAIRRAADVRGPFDLVATVPATPPENVWQDPDRSLSAAYYQIEILP